MTKIPGPLPPVPPEVTAQRGLGKSGGNLSFQGALERAGSGRVPNGQPLDSRTLAVLVRLVQRHLTQSGMTALSGVRSGGGAPGGMQGTLGGLLSQASTQGQLQARMGRGPAAAPTARTGREEASPSAGQLMSRRTPLPEAGDPPAPVPDKDPAKEGAASSASASEPEAVSVKAPSGPPLKTAAPETAAAGDPDVPYNDLIREAADRHGVPEDLVRAVVDVESDFRSDAVSSVGAQGLMQLMPETAKELGVEDPFDPRQNIMGGTRYLKQLLGRYDGDRDLALAAYNWGMGNLERHPEKMPDETVNYIQKVNQRLA